jgi:MFS family permease
VKRFHYAWVVVVVTFFALLAAQAVRAAPGVIITSLESEFGWSRTEISFAISLSILTFGLGGPLGGTLIDRYGPRGVMLVGDLLIVAGLLGLIFVRDLWQMYLLWGLPIGIGTGAVGGVLGAAVAHRWFRTHRGVIIGAFGAATSAGQLIFVPAMAELTRGMAVGDRHRPYRLRRDARAGRHLYARSSGGAGHGPVRTGRGRDRG